MNDFVNEFALQTHSCFHQQSVVQRHQQHTRVDQRRAYSAFRGARPTRFRPEAAHSPEQCFMEEWKQFVAERLRQELAADVSSSTAARNLMALASSTTVSTLGPSGLASATLVASGTDSNDSSCVEAASSDISATLADSVRESKLHQIYKLAAQTHSLQQLETARPGPKTAFSAFSRTLPSAKFQDYSTSETQSSADSNGSNPDSECSSEDGGKNKIADNSPSVPSRPGPAIPVVYIPSSREELTKAYFIVPIRTEFADAVESDPELQPELQLVKQSFESQRVPTSTKLTVYSANVNQYAQLRDQLTLRDGLALLPEADDPKSQAAEQQAAGADFSGPELYSPEHALDMVFGKTSAAFEQLQLQQAQRLARVLVQNNSLEPNNCVSINSSLFKLHLDPVGLSIGSETQQPDPQRIELLQWLQVSDPNFNRVGDGYESCESTRLTILREDLPTTRELPTR